MKTLTALQGITVFASTDDLNSTNSYWIKNNNKNYYHWAPDNPNTQMGYCVGLLNTKLTSLNCETESLFVCEK